MAAICLIESFFTTQEFSPDDVTLKALNNALKLSGDTEKVAGVQYLIAKGILQKVFKLLENEQEDFPESVVIACLELIAECSTTLIGRRECTRHSLIKVIIMRLSSNNNEMILQICRALANISYDNDSARNIVYEENGMEKLFELIKSLNKDECSNLPASRIFGCILNLTVSCEKLQQQALDIDLTELILQYLKTHLTPSQCEEIEATTRCWLILCDLAESENGQSKIMDEQSLSFLMEMMKTTTNADAIDAIFEIFRNLCINDTYKVKLAKFGICEALLEIVKKDLETQADQSDRVNVCKLASDLMTIILTGDDSMKYLFNSGKGDVYHGCLEWLQCEKTVVQNNAVLAMANFARCEENCVQLMSDGVGDQLVSVLKTHSSPSGNINLQHAVLSALKNLAIPVPNKEPLLKTGLLSSLVEMVKIETYPVVYKLLGTLRMVIDQQEAAAKELGMNEMFVKRVVHWSTVEDHAGVKGEAERLLTKIAICHKSKDACKKMLSCGVLPPIVSMLHSEYSIMRSEGTSAIHCFAILCLATLEKEIKLDDFIKALVSSFQAGLETADITLALMGKLTESDMIYESFNSPGLFVELEKLKNCSMDLKNTKVIDAILALKIG